MVLQAIVEFNDCSFNNNKGGQGGGMAIYSGANVTLIRCKFLENEAGACGWLWGVRKCG